jgi:hypothetical protein
VDPLILDTKLGRKWRNAHCDAQAAWACIKYDQDIFVTSNIKDFQKNISQLIKLGLTGVATPSEASQILQ